MTGTAIDRYIVRHDGWYGTCSERQRITVCHYNPLPGLTGDLYGVPQRDTNVAGDCTRLKSRNVTNSSVPFLWGFIACVPDAAWMRPR
jgi:hypothetical protein